MHKNKLNSPAAKTKKDAKASISKTNEGKRPKLAVKASKRRLLKNRGLLKACGTAVSTYNTYRSL